MNFRKSVLFKNIFRLKEMYMFMALATCLAVLFYCHATADILTKLLQQCFIWQKSYKLHINRGLLENSTEQVIQLWDNPSFYGVIEI